MKRWKRGDRVSVPFIAGCGRCRPCRAGDQQVCDRQFQPGFHGWGGLAERAGLRHADLTLAALPDVAEEVRDVTGGGAHASIDALGHPDTCFNSVACLRKRGRHVQVGLMTLAEGIEVLTGMDDYNVLGVVVIDRFGETV